MKLAHLATNYIIITRMVAVGGYKKALSTVTGMKCALQPLGAEKTALMGGVLGKTYRIFCDSGVDIQEHDKLRDYMTGDLYKVKVGGVTVHSAGSIEYQEVLIEKIS